MKELLEKVLKELLVECSTKLSQELDLISFVLLKLISNFKNKLYLKLYDIGFLDI